MDKPTIPQISLLSTDKLNSILAHTWQMQKDGKANTTAQNAYNYLTQIAKVCDINNPEAIKDKLAKLKWRNSTKHHFAAIYTEYLKYIGKTWTRPTYTIEEPLPFIPNEQEIDQLIAAGQPKTATLLQLLKETAARIGEVTNLEWKHIDTERHTVNITGLKGSHSRILPISSKLCTMLNSHPKVNEKVFQTTKIGLRKTIEKLRRTTAKKLSNPRLLNIHFHTFRHWKATMEYHRTKDIMHVKTMLGHKSIENTVIYINLENALFLSNETEWFSKVAHNADEALKLLESGFEYVQTIETLHLCRKRK